MKRFAAAILSLTFSAPLVAAPGQDSQALGDELKLLSQQGATGLASLLLDQAEPDRVAQPQEWQQWHRDKLAMLVQQGHWQAVINEYEAQQQHADPDYLHWLRLQAVRAYISLGQGEQARDLLLPLIWSGEAAVEEIAELRRLVLQSYLVDGRVDNALTAVRRYELDYPDAEQNSEWLALKARSLVAQGEANDAAILTVVSDAPQAKAAYTLALMEGLTALDDNLWQQGLYWLEQPTIDAQYRQSLFTATFNKVKQVKVWGTRIRYLERLLQIGGSDNAQQIALVDALWFAYVEYGQQLANQRQLLIGNFDPWFELAAQFPADKAVESEAVYAWLALRSDDAAVSSRAHDLFVTSLMNSGRSYAVRPLYLSATQFSNKSLPLVLTYRLVDLALAEKDLAQASMLMSQLDAPEGIDVMEWQMRRARLQILTGVTNYGMELLQQVVAADSLTRTQIEYLILATQDLKQKGKYDEAYSVLAQLLNKAPDRAMNQQLLFWMADCRQYQQRYVDAAELYLRAASQFAEAGDWSLASYQRAAEVLQQAGQRDDALRLYERIWAKADGSQRLLIQAKIQRLKALN